MGHLVNPASSQIKHHGSWKITWSQYFRRDFSYFFFIDQYIKSLVYSLTFLKSFFNKFFFYELKYFLKNNYIFFFFSFKFLRKSAFKFYWKYIHRSRFLSRFISFSRKKQQQSKLENTIALSQFNELSMKKKIELIDNNRFQEPYYYLLSSAISLAKNKKGFNDFFLRKKSLNFFYLLLKFKLNRVNQQVQSLLIFLSLKYLFKIKNILFTKFSYLRYSRLYSSNLIFALNSSKNFAIVRDVFSKILFFLNVKACLMSDYIYYNNFHYNKSMDHSFLLLKRIIKIISYSQEVTSKFFQTYSGLLHRKKKTDLKNYRSLISKKKKESLRRLLKELKLFNINTSKFMWDIKGFLKIRLFQKITKEKSGGSIPYVRNYIPVVWLRKVMFENNLLKKNIVCHN